MTKADFIEKSKLILTNTFVKGGSTEDVFDEIYDKLVLPQANVIKKEVAVCEQHWFRDGYCTNCGKFWKD